MLLLVESAAGYALFRVKNDDMTGLSIDEIAKRFSSPAAAKKEVSLKAFGKFANVQDALGECSALQESKMGKRLKTFLKKNVVKACPGEALAICDSKLAAAVKKKLDINVVFDPTAQEILRGIRTQLEELVTDLSAEQSKNMTLSLSHSLNRFKLKFTSDKVDTMVIQAVGLLDDLDKELNNFAMRLKEWYGWHFPELAKIVSDNAAFAKVVRSVGERNNCLTFKGLGEIITPELAEEVIQASQTSMGSDITEEDLTHMLELADRVIELTDYRKSLADYLKVRMETIAPNMTFMVGELVGAKLLAAAGSLMSLAKHPSSTVQILGAEKALFRALKSRSNTPKYGLLYHASLINSAAPKLKGKMSRVLAAKLALCVRVDALGDSKVPNVAIAARRYVDQKLEQLSEEAANHAFKSGMPILGNPTTSQPVKYTPKRLRVE